MRRSHGISRRAFLGSAAVAASTVYLPGIGRVQARPAALARLDDYQGRLCYNENPLGPSPAALAALQEAATLAHRYPDWYNNSLESRIAAFHGFTDPGTVCAGAGATEVIRLIADAFLGPGDEVILATPTYTQMAGEAAANGASAVHVPVDGNHVIDLSAILSAVGPATTLISLVNPNNPLGTVYHRSDMDAFLAALPGGIIVVVDEAYHDYVHSSDYESSIRHIGEGRPVIVVRTFSKTYGLAGARIGYAIGASSYISLIASSQNFGMIARPCQAAAQAALDDHAHVAETVALNDQAMALLQAGLNDLGLSFIPSQANFMMFDTGTNASAVAAQLGALGYQVRTGWGMPQHIRVSTGTLAEVQGFLDALQSIVATPVAGDWQIPSSLAVLSTSPNPFNGRCRVKLAIPGTEPVHLTVFDVAGRKVRSLVAGALEPGIHEITWDGEDHSGRTVASGSYILNLIQGEFATSSRVAYLK